MKQFVYGSFLALGLSISAFAEHVVTPSASTNAPAPIDYAGVLTYRIASSTGGIVTTNPVIVYGVSTSSVAATAYVQFFSTNAIQLNGAVPAKVQFNDNYHADEDVTATQEYTWVRPMKFPKGLVVKASASPGAGTDQVNEWVIYYREAK